MYFIGIDLGTSSLKLLLVDRQGTVLRTVTKEYPLLFPQPGWLEQEPARWWQAVREGVAFAIRDSFAVARSLGIAIPRSMICGGGSKSPLWRQMIADILDIPLDIPATEQGSSYDGAMLAREFDGSWMFVAAAEGDGDLINGRGDAYCGMLDWAETHKGSRKYVAFADKCWPAFPKEFGFEPCYVNSRFAARGIPVSCEVDIYGALSEYIGACVSQDAVTLLDINNSVPARLWEDRIRGRYDYQLTDTFMGFPCGNTPSCKMCADQRHLSHDPQRNDVGRHGTGSSDQPAISLNSLFRCSIMTGRPLA